MPIQAFLFFGFHGLYTAFFMRYQCIITNELYFFLKNNTFILQSFANYLIFATSLYPKVVV